MELLLIVPYVPNLIRTRPYNILRHLARLGHRITLATLWSDENERAGLASMENQGIQVLAARLTRMRSLGNSLMALPRRVPLQSVYCWQPELLKSIESIILKPNSHFDLVHVEHLRGARYGIGIEATLQQMGSAVPIVWDSVDCISYLFEQTARKGHSARQRLIARFELPRTRRYEAWLAPRFDRVLLSSEQDRQAFCELLDELVLAPDKREETAKKIKVLGNGVDLEYFSPAGHACDAQTIVFSGKMSYHANIASALYLADEIMPLVWREFPSAKLEIVGQDPPGQVINLANRHPGRVVVTGTVADLRPYLAQATVAAVPLVYGAGIQNKVLEAMAMETPVIVTTKAVSALAVRDQEEVLIADSPELFSRQIIRLLRDASLCARLGASGRRYVELNHNWKQVAEQLEIIYQEAIIDKRRAQTERRHR